LPSHKNTPGGLRIKKKLDYDINSMILTIGLQFDTLHHTKYQKGCNLISAGFDTPTIGDKTQGIIPYIVTTGGDISYDMIILATNH